MAGLQENLSPGIYIEASKTAARKSAFEKWFSNSITVVSCDQQGDFGARVEIAANWGAVLTDEHDLRFYSYDRGSNTYTSIANPDYRTDSNGYLHFYTDKGGDIILSDGPLVRR